jgi:hypothetical protein
LQSFSLSLSLSLSTIYQGLFLQALISFLFNRNKPAKMTFASYGRGGAGNFGDASQTAKVTEADLSTPTLKSSVITTGRGGSGNMAKNDDPVETRLRQDVEGVPRRPSSGAQHYGRGGAANVFKPEEIAAAQKASNDHAVDDSSSSRKSFEFESLAAKGKALLFGKK